MKTKHNITHHHNVVRELGLLACSGLLHPSRSLFKGLPGLVFLPAGISGYHVGVQLYVK
jgi:hypothetical protein